MTEKDATPETKPKADSWTQRWTNWRRSFGLPNPGPFEQLHKEVRGVFVTNFLFDGLKVDFGAGMSPHFQVSQSFALLSPPNPSTYTLSSIYAKESAFVTGSMDTMGSFQARGNYALTKGLTSKFATHFIPSQPAYAQLELDYAGLDFSTNVKAVNPSMKDGTGIYVASHLQSLTKKLAVGVEVAAQHPDPNVLEFQSSFVGKYSGKNFVLTANVAQFGVLQTSYFHQVNDNTQLGAEVQLVATPEKLEGVATVGAKIEYTYNVARCQVDTTGRVCSFLEQRILPGLSFVFSADLDHMKGVYKFGMGAQMEA